MLTDAELRLRDTASKKILLEVTALKAIEARNAVSLDAVLKQLNQLRGNSGAGFQPGRCCSTPTERRPPARPVAESQVHAGPEAGAPISAPAALAEVPAGHF
ncbi:MAG: hypothetical protein WDM80_05055 [Limisphaerales bacterium]